MVSADEQERARAEALDNLVASTSRLKLVVAGPGTGKTFAFKRLLEGTEGRGLAMTFLSLLVKDLHKALDEKADVYSFHGFARRLLHRLDDTGVSKSVQYYPPLVELIREDIRIVAGVTLNTYTLGALFRHLADEDQHLKRGLASGEYYDAVSYDDSVYRVLRALEADPSRIPPYAQLVVDEFQDFCPMEVAFIAILSTELPTLIVGDDDQALYAFRDATPEAIRSLVAAGEFTRFDLPFCTRCTEVTVAATHTVIAQASAAGLLRGRIEKRFECYMPEKRDDSARYPHIIHARCTTQTKKAPYMCEYIHRTLESIPEADVQASHESGTPTVLIIGPNPFFGQIEGYLRERDHNVITSPSTKPELDVLHAYRMLANDDGSNLGWRILLQLERPPKWQQAVREALSSRAPLWEFLDDAFVQDHRWLAELVSRADAGEQLDADQLEELARSLGVESADVGTRLDPPVAASVQYDVSKPLIMLTSLMGSKGLQADHVFIVGVNEAHFPHDNGSVTDEEVCQLLVALTRARKACTLLSSDRLGAARLRGSVFVEWLRPHIEDVRVDRSYFGQ